MVSLFAAGNDGTDLWALVRSVLKHYAKNRITVGASENDRPELEITYG